MGPAGIGQSQARTGTARGNFRKGLRYTPIRAPHPPSNPTHTLLLTILVGVLMQPRQSTMMMPGDLSSARDRGAAADEETGAPAHTEIAPRPRDDPGKPWHRPEPTHAYNYQQPRYQQPRLLVPVGAAAAGGNAPAAAAKPAPAATGEDGSTEHDRRPAMPPYDAPFEWRAAAGMHEPPPPPWPTPSRPWSRPGRTGAPPCYGGTGVIVPIAAVRGNVRAPLGPFNPTRSYSNYHAKLWRQQRDPAVPPGGEGRRALDRARRERNGMLKSIVEFGTGAAVDHCVYTLVNDVDDVYVGYSWRNPLIRLGEHNQGGGGDQGGGGGDAASARARRGRSGKRRRYTRRGKKWFLLFSVHGHLDKRAALNFETAWKKKSVGSRQIRDSSLKKQVQLLLLLAKPEYHHLIVCGHWLKTTPYSYTRSVPMRDTYTEDALLAAGFSASDAKLYSVAQM